GASLATAEEIRATLPLWELRHFATPFLAAALGTLAGGCTAALIAASRKTTIALVLGGIFQVLGIVMISMVGGPAWFIAGYLVLAFLPMAWFGGWIGKRLSAR